MSKFLTILAATTMLSSAAFAQVTTIEFAQTDGEAVTFAFDSETNTSTNVATGETGAYTFDEATNVLCGTGTDGVEICVTFEAQNGEPKAGDTGPYTTNLDTAGTATIISVE